MPPPSQLPPGFELRPLAETDSLEELTELLHLGYKRLADMGLRFVATYQDVETTRKRVGEGACWVAASGGRLVGTITLYDTTRASGCAWYERPEVACFGQFTVHPDMQGSGVGSAMMELVERLAREGGATELALDTAEPAEHLIRYYKNRGYRFIEYVQWDVTNYRSVILSKTLASIPP
jgi:GNAT superfamily N-acetyltransferase